MDPIELISLASLGLIGFSSINLLALLACQLVGLVSFIGSWAYLCFYNRLAVAEAIITATKISQGLNQAATHGVAMVHLSTTKILNTAKFHYLTASFHVDSCVRKMIWCWLALARKKMWWWIALFVYSYHNDALQYHLAAAILVAAAKMISQQHMQAAHGELPRWDQALPKLPMRQTVCIASLNYAHSFVRES
jgi:hypothetical protein